MKKGFTIIELLAVLTVLAVISVIAIPIILDAVKDSKESSYEKKGKLFIKNIENKLMQDQMDKIVIADGEYRYNNSKSKICLYLNSNVTEYCIENIDIESNKPNSVEIEIKNYEVTYYKLDYTEKFVEFGARVIGE